ncbi:MAG TPA: hypothetical protein VFW33_12670 [Gemmataceae bacterium]|nr:hypothetical protein [Gemmataceae bacterium]
MTDPQPPAPPPHVGVCRVFRALLPLVVVLGSAPAARAAPLVVEAGQTHTLREDVTLDGDDVLEVRGTPEKPSVLVGNRHRIRSGPKWTGSLKITHCTIRDLGGLPRRTADDRVQGPGDPAFDLKVAGKGGVVIEHCTLDACAALRLQTDESSTASFRHNTVLENAAVAVSKDIGNSGDCFTATGTSREKKWFQGNFIPRGKVVLRGANWLVGGDRDADSNLFIGYRIGIVADGAGTVVRGNYFHLLMPITKEYPYWSQISVFTTGPEVVGEHNVVRDGEWIVRFVEGEFRYNVITDIVDHNLMQNGSNGRVHHNLFLAGTSAHRQGSMGACIGVIYAPKKAGEGIEVFNNVFDGGGRLDVPGIEVAPRAFVKSVRNNVFFNFAHKDRYYKRPQAMIRTIWNDESTEERPARLGYADYNLFFSPGVRAPRNYLLSVSGKEEGKDAGFGRNDVPRGGRVDDQADPRFRGPIPKAFPFADDDVRARKVGVSKMLAFYREAYTPAEGSPLIGAGDPADGEGTNIGAVGPSKRPEADRFGRFGAK